MYGRNQHNIVKQLSFNSMWAENVQMSKLDLEKEKEKEKDPEIKSPNSTGS